MKIFAMRRLIAALCATGLFGVPLLTYASGFQLWEQDGASIGNYHAGYAAWANDASTAFYNPAGITLIKNQQLVVAGDAVMTDFKFTGNVAVSTINYGEPLSAVAQGGNFAFIPALHYVAPISDWASFGFSMDIPFGLKTSYGESTPIRYASTESSVTAIDISPVLAFQPSQAFSFGAGPDIQRMYGEFDQVATMYSSQYDTKSTNKLSDTGYGYHAGLLYQFSPDSRVGASYHSKVNHHLSGSSKFFGPLADPNLGVNEILNNQSILISQRATLNMQLPAYTALSAYHKVHPKVAIMGSVIYTQWNVIKELVLNNVAGIVGVEQSTAIQVVVPEHFRNTWNASIGTDYYATDRLTVRSGIGYDETPVKNAYRNVSLPDNNRFVLALGGHYQATPSIGMDLGWTHLFISKANVNPPPESVSAEVVTTNGSVTGGADVLAGQVTWDIT